MEPAADQKPRHTPTTANQVGLVLSGGGVRGAYEAGVLAGIAEALELAPESPPPYSIYAGTSVGAVNASHLVAGSHRGDLCIDDLVATWKGLDVERYMRLRPWAPFLAREKAVDGANGQRWRGRSVFDPRALEALVRRGVDWELVRKNLDRGHAQALLVTALDVDTGQTCIFADLGRGGHYRRSPKPRRRLQPTQMGSDHVLASSAIPFLYPIRRIEGRNYCDGGLRFNTPIAPAIRAGANKLVVICAGRGVPEDELSSVAEAGPQESLDPMFLAGKILNALLLDPVGYDLDLLERLNKLNTILARSLLPEQLREVERALEESRGAGYRNIETLVFAPSADIGTIASEHLAEHGNRWRLGPVGRWLLNRSATAPGDLISYVLLDGEFAAKMVELGRKDALERRSAIRIFFGLGAEEPCEGLRSRSER